MLSPSLFNVYVNDLSVSLNKLDIGCLYNGIIINNFLYADDSCVLAPSPAGLQKLLNVCSQYAIEHTIIYNPKKTVCICFRGAKLSNLKIPRIYLDGTLLQFVDSTRYLGIILTDNLNDNKDISRHVKYIYFKGNLITRKFANCSVDVKRKLFTTFCYAIYGGPLWSNFNNSSFTKAKVAFNNVYRHLFNFRRGLSVSHSMVLNGIDCFNVLIRKHHYSFRTRLHKSSNSYVQSVIHSFYFMYESRLSHIWKKDLFRL